MPAPDCAPDSGAAIVEFGRAHNAARYLRIVYQLPGTTPVRGGKYERQRAAAGYWIERACPCHRGERLTLWPYESRAAAETGCRLLLRMSEMTGAL
jgi:hypothetical protein